MIALYSNLEKLYIKTTIKAIRRNVYYYFHKKRVYKCVLFFLTYIYIHDLNSLYASLFGHERQQ